VGRFRFLFGPEGEPVCLLCKYLEKKIRRQRERQNNKRGGYGGGGEIDYLSRGLTQTNVEIAGSKTSYIAVKWNRKEELEESKITQMNRTSLSSLLDKP
jgi:hypothetical protein